MLNNYSITLSTTASRTSPHFGIFALPCSQPVFSGWYFSTNAFLTSLLSSRLVPSFSIHCLSASSFAFLTTTSSSSHLYKSHFEHSVQPLPPFGRKCSQKWR